MSTRAQHYLEAVEHLPDDAVLILHGVTWEEYEELLEDMNDWPGKRVTYYKGKLEIVGPSLKHEKIEVSNSAFFPGLAATILSDFAQPSRTQGRTQALAAFRDWLER